MVDSVLELYSNKLKAKEITIQRSYAECPLVRGIPGELRQAISNLLSNAVDAVPQNGNIKLGLQCITHLRGREIQLAIEDDGPGIPAENLSRIFEPFFTTKKDVGTGLGLYVTRQILERHGGAVTVHSRAGDHRAAGTCVVLTLPCDLEAEPGNAPAGLA